jgi:hypothetical protein
MTAGLTRPRAILSGVLFCHVVALLIAAAPGKAGPLEAARKFVTPYVRVTGLEQSWSMFAPDPPLVNGYVEARIAYRDATTSFWKFPIPSDYGLYDRYMADRYRKWGNDWIPTDKWEALRPDAARYIARTHDDPRNPPVSVTLVRHWAPIIPPSFGRPAPPPVWQQKDFFTYVVQPEDLR